MKLIYAAALTLVLLPMSGPVTAQDNSWRARAIKEAVRHHRTHVPDGCEVDGDDLPQATHDLPIGEDTAARQALLLQFSCRTANSVYLLSDEMGTVSEVWLLTPFVANPSEINAADGPAGEQVRIDWRETREISQPKYDQAGRVLTATHRWFGESEPYSTTSWGFRDGRFQLMQFAVDASVNGQSDPEVLFRSHLW